MNRTEQLANDNGWDSKKLGAKLDAIFAPVYNGIESGQHTIATEALEKLIVAVADANEALPHSDVETIIEAEAERLKRDKGYTRITKMMGSIIVMLYLVGFRTAEAIAKQLERKNWNALADRCLTLAGPYVLISRLFGAGIRCKLADVRAEFRILFNSALNPHDVKKRIAEHMLGEWITVPATGTEPESHKFKPFALAERTFELYVIGETTEVTLPDGTKFQKHIASALERFEEALRFDGELQRKGTASNTAEALRLNPAEIRQANVAYLEAEQKQIAEAKAKAEAEAKRKADEKEALRIEALRKEQAEAEAAQKAKAEADAKAQAEAEAERQRKAEADKLEASKPANQRKADSDRKAKAANTRKQKRNAREQAHDVRLAA